MIRFSIRLAYDFSFSVFGFRLASYPFLYRGHLPLLSRRFMSTITGGVICGAGVIFDATPADRAIIVWSYPPEGGG